MSEQTFEIYDGDAIVTVERSPERDKEVVDAILLWMQNHSAVSGESIFQSDICQETACILLGDLADDVFRFEVEWKDD